MPASLIVLGIDAANPDLVRRWAADGTLPNLGRLFARGRSGTVRTAEGFFPSTWPCMYTGCSPAEHGFHYGVQLRPGTYELYAPGEGELSHREPFWRALSRAGKRVAMLDVPMVPLDPTVNGIHLVEWGGHDAVYGFAASPAEVGEEILAREGPHPQPPGCDATRRTVEDYRSLLDALDEGVARRTRFARRLLARERWDLFLHVFSEAHCVGHQCWHLHDPTHPAYEASIVAALGDPIERIYAGIDRSIGQILADADEAAVIVFSAHGMRHWYGAHFLLRDILVRLGVTVPAPEPTMALAQRIARVGWRALPVGVRRVVKRALGRGDHPRAGAARTASGGTPLGVPGVVAAASRCFPLANGLAATGIRLNLRGREPAGLIERGAEAQAFEDELIRELLAITDERTGRPLVRTVLRTRALYAGAALDALPDLLVEWSDEVATGSRSVGTGAGATVRARSPRIGVVEGTNGYCRTGEHRPEGFIVAAGPGIEPGPLDADISVMDLAPTFATELGVPLDGVDGRVVAELIGDRSARRVDGGG